MIFYACLTKPTIKGYEFKAMRIDQFQRRST